MNLRLLLTLAATSFLFSSCLREAYFLNPLHGNNQPYRSVPLVSDSSHNATYVHGSLAAGGANDQLSDGVVSFQGSIYQAHTLQNVQFYYGATGTLGNYHVNTDHYYDNLPNSNLIDYAALRGDYFFAGAGGIGGFNFVMPFASGGEWRVFGIEGSVQKEFGDYLSMRKSIPDSAANGIDRNDVHGTIAISTNVIKKFRKSGNSFGYKMAFVWSTNTISEFQYNSRRDNFRPRFLSNTFHLTADRITGFAQFNIGSYVGNVQVGVNYRLTK